MKKVFCDDCQTEVNEIDTVLMGEDVVCKDCALLDILPEPYININDLEQFNVYLH